MEGVSIIEIVLNFKIFLLCIISLLIVGLYRLQAPRNLPPGPTGWPLLGILPNLGIAGYKTGLATHEILTNFAERFGEVYCAYMGRRLVLILNSYGSIKEAFQNTHLLDRPQSSVLDDVVVAKGIAQANGESWKQQRRFTQNTFRSFGVGKSKFEDHVLNEAEAFLEQVSLTKGEAFDIRHDLGNASSNIICSTVFGKRYDYNDANFKVLRDLVYSQFILLGSGGMNLFIPILQYLQPQKQNHIRNNYRKLYKFIGDVIEQHKAVFDSENLNDYIDVYLREIEINKTLGRESYISEDTMVAAVGNLFGAGSDTTGNTLYWALLYMIEYPEIQTRIKNEIDQAVGRNRMPRMADKPDLPYTEATLLEVLRHVTILPMGGPHCAAEATTLLGYDIPKGTILLPNIWAVHNDPSVWQNGEQFKPERFLDADETKVRRRDEFIPFSTGRRNCPGENLAKMSTFVFFTHLLHQFTFSKANDTDQFDFKGITGAIKFPHPYKLRAHRRE